MCIRDSASAGAVRAGTDLECGSEYASLADAVKAGLIDEKEIDISLKRLLTARFEDVYKRQKLHRVFL